MKVDTISTKPSQQILPSQGALYSQVNVGLFDSLISLIDNSTSTGLDTVTSGLQETFGSMLKELVKYAEELHKVENVLPHVGTLITHLHNADFNGLYGVIDEIFPEGKGIIDQLNGLEG